MLFVDYYYYDFTGQRPDRLVFTPPTGDGDLPTATIVAIVFDRDVLVTSFRYLSGP